MRFLCQESDPKAFARAYGILLPIEMPVKNITETEPVFAGRSVTRNPNGSRACLRECAKQEVSPIAFMDGFTASPASDEAAS
jgi:hypothetical protein